MSGVYREGEALKGLDFTVDGFEQGDYEDCDFVDCNFAQTKLSHANFIDCRFENCDLTNAVLDDTAFRNASFKGCKLLGLRFDHCNAFLFEVSFDDCRLDLASFFQRKLKQTRFEGCSLKEADFVEADLTQAVFADCDLKGAMFDRTNLEKADLRTAINYSIDLESNRLAKARFSKEGLPGLLEKYNLRIE